MEDLSNLVPLSVGLTAGESGAAGNTVNRPLPKGIGAPGSEPVNPMPALSEEDNPGIQLPAEGAHVHEAKFSNSPTSVDGSWKKV